MGDEDFTKQFFKLLFEILLCIVLCCIALFGVNVFWDNIFSLNKLMIAFVLMLPFSFLGVALVKIWELYKLGKH
jgi:hypothetical protein